MNDRPTPETDALAVVCYGEGGIEASYGFRAVPIKDCRKLERERDRYKSDVEVITKERDEQTAQMCQAIGYLSTIAEDCESWLNGECEEPSMDFIKAVRDYARKAING